MDQIVVLVIGIIVGYWLAIFFRGIFNMSALRDAVQAVQAAVAEAVALNTALKTQVGDLQKQIADRDAQIAEEAQAVVDLNAAAAQLKGGQ